MNEQMVICIDFDGTCVTHEFPHIGKDIGAIPVLKKLIKYGHKLVLFTMRSDVQNPFSTSPEILDAGGCYLTNAVNWLEDRGVDLYGVNSNPTQSTWTHSPKAYGHIYIDDAALGCPVIHDQSICSRPYVDWIKVEELLKLKGLFV